jgi:argininosuccinate synthase
MQRIVLAHSGGLDTSVAIPWLREHCTADVVAVTLDLGQGHELADIRERALALGAVRAHVIDAREQFVREFILPALQAGAVYEDRYLLATALSRPLLAKKLVEMARMEGAVAIAHGCSGNANDQIRLDVSLRALDPGLQIVRSTAARELAGPQLTLYARAHGIEVPPAGAAEYSIDTNLWGRSIAFGVLADPWVEPPEDVYTLTRAARDCPDEPAFVELEFEAGVPVRANGIDLALLEMIESLETIAGAHGVGRIDMMENRLVGSKSREVYEAPAAVILHAAHRELESLVITRDLERVKHNLARTYADLVYNGLWFSHARMAIDAFVAAIQARVTGGVRLKLFKGSCRTIGRRSPHALDLREPGAHWLAEAVHRTEERGFLKLWELPSEDPRPTVHQGRTSVLTTTDSLESGT